jgi:sec-independent protein translocase protein TatB
MLDIGFLEIVVIGALALIVVGPKDLPGLLRTVGQFVAKARTMARDFQRTMEEAARDADLGDVADAVKKGGKLNKNSIVDSLKDFEKTVKTEVNEAKASVTSSGSSIPTPKPAATPVTPASVTPAEKAAAPVAASSVVAASPPKPAEKQTAKKPAAKAKATKASPKAAPKTVAAKAETAKPAPRKKTGSKAAAKPSPAKSV